MTRWGLMVVAVWMAGVAGLAPVQGATVTTGPTEGLVAVSLRPVARTEIPLPAMRWGGARGSGLWTRAAVMALRSHASVLPKTVPGDIAQWCPAYEGNGPEGRLAFWVGLLSALAKHESTYDPRAVGGGGKWIGLLQILPATARYRGCRATTPEALKNGGRNLQCALRIMAHTVPRDGVVSRGMRGVAADWGPFHNARKRADMMSWMRRQPYCVGLGRSLRPVARPGSVLSTQGRPVADGGN